MENKKIAVIFLGPPGSGKTTQAEMLLEEYGLEHFNTGEVIKKVINDPSLEKNSVVQREKQLYESGALNTDEWVTELVVSETEKIAASGKGVVFSGSPRRLLEAEALFPKLATLYGAQNICVFYLPIIFETALKRIEKRRLCSKCGLPLLAGDDAKICKKCGGEIIARLLDDPYKLKLRFSEYYQKTEPLIAYAKNQNTNVYEIDGEGSPDAIHKEICDIIMRQLAKK